MGGVRVETTDRSRIALHVIDGSPLATHGLRSMLRAFPKVTFHDKMPSSLRSRSSTVLVVDAGTLSMPVTEFLRTARLESCLTIAPNTICTMPFVLRRGAMCGSPRTRWGSLAGNRRRPQWAPDRVGNGDLGPAQTWIMPQGNRVQSRDQRIHCKVSHSEYLQQDGRSRSPSCG